MKPEAKEYAVRDAKTEGLWLYVKPTGTKTWVLFYTLGGKQPPPTEGFSAEQRFFLGWAQVWCNNVTEEAPRRVPQMSASVQ